MRKVRARIDNRWGNPVQPVQSMLGSCSISQHRGGGRGKGDAPDIRPAERCGRKPEPGRHGPDWRSWDLDFLLALWRGQAASGGPERQTG